MRGKAVDAYYGHLINPRRPRRQQRETAPKGTLLWRPAPRLLAEDANLLQQFQSILQPAIEYLQRQSDDLHDLPADSPDKLFIESMLGALNRHWRDDEDLAPAMVKENATLLADRLRLMVKGTDSDRELYAFATRLASELDEFRIRIGPDTGAEVPEAGGEVPDTGEAGEEPPPEPEPAAGEEADRNLMQKLGLG